ncbi:MAG: NAD(P)H-dependent glycerol-3-phosphate dehydrogenase [Gammaproteobacteria bacterium]|nr:NAD(P)H-dependent glycerol-3-phosphate dehydrogenase [Gammaproteobacteria bacterium]MDE0366373.1 NAD(P)H-dependent glycerol-3-phosphate dehydrogenase [Gammaproteobacteria bacterium]
MISIAVLGLGNFGTALARIWSLHGNRVCGWTVEEEVFASIRETGVNAKYLPDVVLPGAEVTMDLGVALDGAEVVVLALPSHVILEVVDDIGTILADRQILLDLAKGLAPGERLVSEAIKEKLGAAGCASPLAVMTGPTIAREVAAGVLTTALVASEELSIARTLAQRLSTDTLKLRFANDPLGVELWGAFKNVIALACGVCDGLGGENGAGGDNLKAAVFTAGFREACRLLQAMGAQPETALSPAGVGDLFVTATSPHGRNRRTGELLGSGKPLDEALGSTVMVSEGVRATRMFAARAAAEGLPAPFVTGVLELLDGAVTAPDCVQALLQIDA